MKNKIFSEISLNLILTIVVNFFLFLINRYFTYYIGIEKLGLMKLFTQLLAYINLAETGLAFASTYALYKPLVEKNYEKISIIITTIDKFYRKIMFVVLILGILVIPFLNFIIKDSFLIKNIFFYWILYVINTSLSYTYASAHILLIADQKYINVRVIQSFSRLFCYFLQIIVIIKLQSFLLFILVLFSENIIQFIYYKKYFKKNYSYIYKTEIYDNNIIKDTKNLFWHKTSSVIVLNTDLILISKFISLKEVGIYSNYQMIVQTLIAINFIIFNIIKPRIGRFMAKNTLIEIFYCWKKINIIFLFSSILFTFLTYKLINNFIILWIGKEFLFPNTTVLLILINLFINCFRGITDIFKDGSGFFDDIHLPIAEAIINFILSIILVQLIGLNGIIIGTIVSNILIICIAKPIMVFRRCFDKDIKDYIKIYGNYLILIIISLFSCNYILNFIPLKEVISWFDWIINGILVGSISLIVIFVIFLSNKDFRDNLKYLKR